MYAVYLGRALQTVNPPNASVGSAQIADSLISGKTALGATPADTDELLISDAGTLKRVDYSHLKSANTPSFRVTIGSNQTISDDTSTLLAFDTEDFDTNSAYTNTSSNYKFTVPSDQAGKYFFTARANWSSTGSQSQTQIEFYKNGSPFSRYLVYNGTTGSGWWNIGNSNNQMSHSIDTILNLSVGDYIQVYSTVNTTDGSNIVFAAGGVYSEFSGYKIIT